MKTTQRFDNAVTKLYNAFHEGKLDAYSCTACAVGNICDNNSDWARDLRYNDFRLVCSPYLKEEDFCGLHISKSVIKSGYSLFEISMIEKIFLDIHRPYDMNIMDQRKEEEFKGLCAVVEYLCELDNIPNVMDYTKLFETENDNPKYQLS